MHKPNMNSVVFMLVRVLFHLSVPMSSSMFFSNKCLLAKETLNTTILILVTAKTSYTKKRGENVLLVYLEASWLGLMPFHVLTVAIMEFLQPFLLTLSWGDAFVGY